MSAFPLSRLFFRRSTASLCAALCLSLVAPVGAMAQEPTFVEQSRDWDVYTTTMEGSQACFVAGIPNSYDPMPESRHGEVFFYLTRRPAASIVAEPQVFVGYNFAEGSQVTTTIGASAFTFLTQGPRAYLNNPADGPNLLAAMRAGSEMRVQGTSSRGTAVTYTFSLSGVTAGTNRTAQDCPI